jgi:hypothetical protein
MHDINWWAAIVAALAAFAFGALWYSPPLGYAVLQGVLVGACLVAGSLGINYQFSGRGNALWLIDGGFHAGRFAVMGLVLGLWH